VWVLTDGRYLRQRMPAALLEWLADRGAPTRVLVADDLLTPVGPDIVDGPGNPWWGLEPSDVVVARTRNPFALGLLRQAAVPGVAVLTPWESVAAVRNKARAAHILAARGVAMPQTFLADSLGALRAVPDDCFPLMLKPHLGDNALGIAIIRDRSELDELEWEDGMVLAQRFVESDGVDTKVYAVGQQVWTVRRRSPIGGAGANGRMVSSSSERIEPASEIRRLAMACGEAFGLELFGVDVLESVEGSFVVDVNDFPNYTGIDEAPEAIGSLVLHRLGAGVLR
jgi:ribosomal protein S6--L-glutamate ligase